MNRALIFLVLFLWSGLSFSQEICTNGIDDDLDGLIDLNDPDCACTQVNAYLPNPSFEDNTCCPDFVSQMDCVNDWFQSSTATTDYLNNCDYGPPPELLPLPDGEACIGAYFLVDWMEYIGTCLNIPLSSDQTYTLEFDVVSVMINSFLEYLYINELEPMEISV